MRVHPLVAWLVLGLLTAGLGCSRSRERARGRDAQAAGEGADRGKTQARAMAVAARACEPPNGRPELSACRRACQLNHSNSCANLGIALSSSKVRQARALLERACSGGSGTGCQALAELQQVPAQRRKSLERARVFHRVHCQQGYLRSCSQLADMYQIGKGGPASQGAAHHYRARACSLGPADKCE